MLVYEGEESVALIKLIDAYNSDLKELNDTRGLSLIQRQNKMDNLEIKLAALLVLASHKDENWLSTSYREVCYELQELKLLHRKYQTNQNNVSLMADTLQLAGRYKIKTTDKTQVSILSFRILSRVSLLTELSNLCSTLYSVHQFLNNTYNNYLYPLKEQAKQRVQFEVTRTLLLPFSFWSLTPNYVTPAQNNSANCPGQNVVICRRTV